jgi:hypothetical protein
VGTKLDSPGRRRISAGTLTGSLSWIVIGGIVISSIAILGCCGTFRQIVRKGQPRSGIILSKDSIAPS